MPCPLFGLNAPAALDMVDLSLEIRPCPHRVPRHSVPLAIPRLPDRSSCFFSLLSLSHTCGHVPGPSFQPSPEPTHALPPSKISSAASSLGKRTMCPCDQSPAAHQPLPQANALKNERLLFPPESAPALGLSPCIRIKFLAFILTSYPYPLNHHVLILLI